MKDTLLLHGAIGSKEQLAPLALSLKEQFNVHLLSLPGHGGIAFPEGGISMQHFTDYLIQYLDQNNIEKISIFGYSMGGYVAVLMAQKHPNRVEKVITLATKFHWNEAIAAREIKMLQPEIIEEKIPAFAAELEKRHAPLDWEEQLLQTQALLNNLGKKNELDIESCKNISTPCLLMLGDRDKMVTLEETVNVYQALPNASMAVLPQTGHPLEKADGEMLRFYINRFLS